MKIGDRTLDSKALQARTSKNINKKSKVGTSGVLSSTSLDLTYNSQKKSLMRRKKRVTSGAPTLDDEKNVLLEDNTLPYLFSDARGEDEQTVSSDTISNASLIFETHHTRWFHRCFKCNIALNIAMLVAFILIILLAPWYQIKYSPNKDTKIHLQAVFSLLLISFTTENLDTG